MTEPDAPGWQSPASSGPPAGSPPAAPAPTPYGQAPDAVTAAPSYGQQPYGQAVTTAPSYGQQSYGQAAAPYGQPPYGQSPYGQAAAPYGQPQLGPLGEVRGTGKVIGLTIVTFGIYAYVYNYKVHAQMQRHTGRGIGGGIALLLTLIASVAMPFVTSSEVGSLYTRRGQRPPVTGWTGLWYFGPLVGGYVVFLIALLGLAVGADAVSTDATTVDSTGDAAVDVALTVAFVLYAVIAVGGVLTWFVKTNRALNRYWQSLGVR